MSKYTTEVRFICESKAGLTESVGYDNINEVIHNSYAQIFDNYPIFDENYREALNTKILRHYYTREICAETFGLWKLFLNNKMNEIMPYYNQLYESALLEFNPFYDKDITTQHNTTTDTTGTQKNKANRSTVGSGENKGNNSSMSTGQNKDTQNTGNNEYDLYSDTPQGGLKNLDPEHTQDPEQPYNMNYLTNARNKYGNQNITVNGENNNSEVRNEKNEYSNISNENQEQKNENNINSIEAYIERVKGKVGTTSYSKMLQEFRQTFLNIDMMIIDELKDLFFYVY